MVLSLNINLMLKVKADQNRIQKINITTAETKPSAYIYRIPLT